MCMYALTFIDILPLVESVILGLGQAIRMILSLSRTAVYGMVVCEECHDS